MDNHIIFKEHSILFLLKSLMLDICLVITLALFIVMTEIITLMYFCLTMILLNYI